MTVPPDKAGKYLCCPNHSGFSPTVEQHDGYLYCYACKATFNSDDEKERVIAENRKHLTK